MLLLLAACGSGEPPTDTGFGADPVLPAPAPQTVPTVRIADVTGWPAGRMPTAPAGWRVTRFAGDLNYPRWLHELPNGDVLVSEARTTPKAGIGNRVQSAVVRSSRMVGESANRVTLLRDTNGDGVADIRTTLIEGLKQPFGMAYRDGRLFIAATDAVTAFPFRPGQTRIEQPGRVVMRLPAGGYNNHWTRNLLLSRDGNTLFVSVGSASNIGENGLDEERGRAAIHALDLRTGKARLYGSGLRNPVGMAFEPASGTLWTAVNERDLLGDNLVPDYITSVRDGGFYGWPWSYDGKTVDARVEPARPDMVAKAIRPDYALGAHTASLGLAFGAGLPGQWASGAFVGQHGSWNRSAFAGYKVVFVPFANGRPAGPPRDFLTGFLHNDGSRKVYGRPAGVMVDSRGGLLVADDAGDTVWRVAPAGGAAGASPANPSDVAQASAPAVGG